MCSVRTEPEVPAVRPVAPPAVVLALSGVLARDPRPLASPRADSLERTWLLESEPIRLGAQGQTTTREELQAVCGYSRVLVRIKPAICILYVSICIALPLRVGQYTLLLQRN